MKKVVIGIQEKIHNRKSVTIMHHINKWMLGH